MMEDRARPIAWVMLALLFLAYILSLFDRLILALLVEPIKADLDISDTQLSLLQGLAFVLLYCTLAIPVGRLVDRRPRIPIVAIGVGLWSIMTAVCGVSHQYWLLFLGRVGVGVGESTLSPSTYSLLSNSFPRRQLGIATSIFALGASVGAGLALLIGGALVHALTVNGPVDVPVLGVLQPWQQAFFIVGMPGVVLAAVIAFVPEPERPDVGERAATKWSEVGLFFRLNIRWIAPLFIAVGFSTIVLFGTTSWIIAFFSRAHGWGVQQAGSAAGIANLVGAIIGLLGGGYLSDKVQRAGSHARLFVCCGALLICAVAGAIYPLLGSPEHSAIAWGVVMATASVPIGVAGANLQESTPDRMRGVVAAIYFFVVSIIGIAVGPTIIAVISDTAFGGGSGIRYSLAIVAGATSALSALGFYLAAHAQKRTSGVASHQ